MRGAALQTAKPVFRDQIKSLNMETDYQLAESVLPSNIKLLEGLVLSYPDDTELKLCLPKRFAGTLLDLWKTKTRKGLLNFI